MPTTASPSTAPPGGPSRPVQAGTTRPAGGLRHSDAAALAPPGGATIFSSLVDGVAALERLPMIGTLYRAVTLQDVRPALRLLGGFATGGVPGAVASAVSMAADEVMPQSSAAQPGLPGPTPIRSSLPRPQAANTTDATAISTAAVGIDGDLALRLQAGLAAYDRTRSRSELAAMPEPGTLVAQAGRAAA